MSAQELTALLDAAGKTTFEFTGNDVRGATQEDYENLIEEYPGIASYTDYLDLLRATGGVYTRNADVDLGLYGFGGESVPSFDEGNFLDKDRFFLFGEMMRLPEADPILFAFDTQSGADRVYYTSEDLEEYTPWASSFRELLTKFAAGDYPPPSVRKVSE